MTTESKDVKLNTSIESKLIAKGAMAVCMVKNRDITIGTKEAMVVFDKNKDEYINSAIDIAEKICKLFDKAPDLVYDFICFILGTRMTTYKLVTTTLDKIINDEHVSGKSEKLYAVLIFLDNLGFY